jgi:hypothetical protein
MTTTSRLSMLRGRGVWSDATPLRADHLAETIQVFDILVGYIDLQDWKAAFETALPPRKFVVVKKRKRGKKDSESDEAEVDSGTRQDAKDVDDESAEGEDGEDGADAEEAMMNANA